MAYARLRGKGEVQERVRAAEDESRCVQDQGPIQREAKDV